MVACANCGNQNEEGKRFCTSCGKPLAAAQEPPASTTDKSCPSCGASNREAVKFCVQCGKSLTQEASFPPVAIPPAVPIEPLPASPEPAVAATSSTWTPVQPQPMPPSFSSDAPPVASPQAYPPPNSATPGSGRSIAIFIAAAVILIGAIGGAGYYGYSMWKKVAASKSQAAAASAPTPEASSPAQPSSVTDDIQPDQVRLPDTQPPQNTPAPTPRSNKRRSAADTTTGIQDIPALPAYESQQPMTSQEPPAPTTAKGRSQPAVLIRQVQPKYPALAKMAHVSGPVRLHIVIAADGEVRDAHVISGHRLLSKAATDAVKQWQYSPMMVKGKAVESETEVEVNFTLNR